MRLWIAAAALVTLAALGLAAIPYAIDWEARRPDIEAAAGELSGYTLTIGGPIELALLPRPTLIAKDVLVVGGPDNPIGFELQAKQMDLQLELAPLLAGRPVIHHLRLFRSVLAIDDPDNEGANSWLPDVLGWVSAFTVPGLSSFSVVDGRLDIQGHDPDHSTTLNEVSLDLVMAKDGGPLEAVGFFKTRQHRFDITVNVGKATNDGASTLKLRIGAENGIAEKTTLDFSGVIDQRTDIPGLRGVLDVGGPDLRNGLKAFSAITGYPPAFKSVAQGQAFNLQGRIDASTSGIASEDLRLRLGEKVGSGTITLQFEPTATLDLALDLPKIVLANQANWVDIAPIDLLSSIPALPGEVEIRVRELVYRGQAIRQAAVNLGTTPDGITQVEQAKLLLPGLTEVRFDGDLTPSATGRVLNGRLTTVGDDLGGTLHWLDLIPADRGAGWRGLSLESDLQIDTVGITLANIDMRLDSSKLEGDMSVRFGERLRFGLNVDVDRFDLDLYQAGTDPIALAEALIRPFDDLDGSIDARFERLAWNQIRFEEAALTAKAEDRLVTLEKLAVQTVGETAMALQGTVDLDQYDVDLTTELQSGFPARVLRHIDLGLAIPNARLEPLQLTGEIKGPLERFELSTSVAYDGGQWSIEGQSGWIDRRFHYDLSVDADHPEHQRLVSQFGLSPLLPANDAPGSFEFAGKVRNVPDESLVATGSFRLGPTTITGRLAREHLTPRAKWSAKLSLGNPMKDSLAPFLTLGGLRSVTDWTPRSFVGRLPHIGFRTAWLDDIDGSLELASKGGLAGEGIEFSASLDQGFLYVDQFRATPWNGTLRGELSLERRDDRPYGAIGIELESVDSSAFADWLGIADSFDGPLNLRLDAASIGQTFYDIIATSTGSIAIEIGPGDLRGEVIPEFRKQLIDLANNDAGPTELVDETGDRQLTMPLRSLKAKADVSRGIAVLKDASLMIEPEPGTQTEAAIEGTLDLLLWIAELDLTVADKGEEGEPLTYRIVGPPDRPWASRSSGKR